VSYLQYLENKQHVTGNFPLAHYRLNEHSPDYNMPFHWHKETELLLVRSGNFQLSVDGVIYKVAAGDVCYIAEGCLHGGFADHCEYECLDFDFTSLLLQISPVRDVLKQIGEKQRVIITHFTQNSPDIQSIVRKLFDEIRCKNSGWELQALSGLLGFYGCILQKNLLCPPVGSHIHHQKIFRLKSALEYIDSHYQQNITLEDLSRISGMSPKYFCRLFREVIHRTPIDYLNAFRIDKACTLLETNEYPITEVAFQCGFNDSSYFVRCFKKYKNITPKQYVKIHLPQSRIQNLL